MPDEEIGHQLAEDQLARLHRRRDQLLHRAAFPLPGDRQRGEHRRNDHHNHGDQAGNNVVPRFQVLVEPDPRPHVERDRQRRAAAAPVLFDGQVESVDLGDDAGVADADRGPVRVAAVDDQLHGRIAAGVDPLGEIAGHDQPHHHLARVDRVDQIAIVVELHLQREIAGTGEAADQIAAPRRVALVPHGQRDVVHVQRQREAEQRQQQHGRGHGHPQAARIAHDVQEFFSGDGAHATVIHCRTSRSGCSRRSRSSIRATKTSSSDGSSAALTPGPSPKGRGETEADFNSCGVPRAINSPR